MKQYLMTVLLLLGINFYSFSKYHPLIDESKTWVYKTVNNIVYTGTESPNIGMHTTYTLYYFKGDTMVGDTLYSKLYSQNFHYTFQNGPDPKLIYKTLQKPVFEDFYREDTINKHLIKASTYNKKMYEDIWFDFSLEKNDELFMAGYTINGKNIDSTSQINIFKNEYRKAIFYGSEIKGEGVVLIESIGSIYGFEQPMYYLPLGQDGSFLHTYLICYYDSSGNQYGTCDQPELINGINSFRNIKNNFTIYPNPVSDILNIEIPKVELNSNHFVEVYNNMGQLAMSENLFDKQINVSSLPEGLYYLKINVGDQILTKSFIKL